MKQDQPKNRTSSSLRATSYELRTRSRGVASLPAIILFGGLMIELGLASALLIYYLNNSLYGTRLSQEALVAASAGIEDGILRVVLDKDCPDVDCPASYTINTGNGVADVTICKDTCVIGKTEIVSTGRSLTKKHRFVAILNVSDATGLVTKDSVTEEPL